MPDKVALIVDDEQTIRAYLKDVLRHAGFHTVEAANGFEALEVLRTIGRAVDLLLSDVLMPHMDGVALAYAVRAEFPGTALVLFSGYMNARQLRDLDIEFLQKPFAPATLLAAITRAVGAITPAAPKKKPASETKPSRSQWDTERKA